MTVPGLPAWALPDSYPPPPPSTPVLELERARELAAVPPAPSYGTEWNWERFMGTGLMAGVPVTLPGGQVVIPQADGTLVPAGEPKPGMTWVPTATGGLWIKTDPPPGVPLIQGQPNGDILVLPLAHPSVAGQAGVYTDDAAAINAAAIQAGGSYGYGGRVVLGPWRYNEQSPVVLPQQSIQTGAGATKGVGAYGPVSMTGVRGATILQQNFSGICVYAHRTQAYGQQYGLTAQLPAGAIRDVVIDMTNAGPGSIAWDIGDGWWLDFDAMTINGTSQPAVTANATGNTINQPAGAQIPNGFPVMFLSGTIPAGLAFGQMYYATNSTSATFQLVPRIGASVVTFTTTGSGLTIGGCIGLHHTNQVFWSEKQRITYHSLHNSIAGVFDTMVPANDHSHEYNEWALTLFSDLGQQGFVVAAGANMNGRLFHVQGNMSSTNLSGSATPPGNIAAVTVCGSYDGNVNHGSRFYQTEIRMKVEGNPGNGAGLGVYPYGFYGDGVGYIQECTGHIAHSLGNANVTGQDSQWNGQEFSFSGMINGDSYLTGLNPTAAGGTAYNTSPAFPGFGTAFQNTAPDQVVGVTGGGTTGISVSGQALGVAGGTVFVRAGAAITVNGSGSTPGYAWANVAGSSF